jgi:TAT (twin-arginine translocation) pathway signal sequence
MNTTSRRDFLKLAASVGASVAVAGAPQSHAETEPASGPVRAWPTTKYEKFQPTESPQWESWSGASPIGVHLDPGLRYQEVWDLEARSPMPPAISSIG